MYYQGLNVGGEIRCDRLATSNPSAALTGSTSSVGRFCCPCLVCVAAQARPESHPRSRRQISSPGETLTMSSLEELLAAAGPDVPSRPRRNRKSSAIRSMVRETRLETAQLIYPMFLHADADDVPIASMPGQTRWSLKTQSVKSAASPGWASIRSCCSRRSTSLKTETGEEADNDGGLIPGHSSHQDACPDTCRD